LAPAGFLVEHHQAHLDAQRRRVGQAAQLAFLDVEHRLAEAVAHVLERRVARIAGDREHAVEGGVQPISSRRTPRRIRLQESPRYESSWIASRYGTENARRLPKFLRMRFFSVNE
jgi:IS5 family transposase